MILGVGQVLGNTDTTITLAAAAPAGVEFIKNLEDDDIAHGITLADMVLTQFDKLSEQLRLVNIELNLVKTDLSASHTQSVNDPGGVAFELHSSEASISATGGTREAARDEDFWAIYLVGAFQYTEDLDNDAIGDAQLGSTVLSIADPFNSEKLAYIFLETIRDVDFERRYTRLTEQQLIDLTIAHEVGHLFGLGHENDHGTIMVADNFVLDTYAELNFAGEGLRLIANKKRPGEP